MGSNAAENHPISFKWVMKAMERGAKLISVDPRFTRTSSKADIYAPLRSGTDIVFLNGLLKYIIDEKLYDDFYIKNYTNAPFLVNTDFRMPGDLDGVFSGYDSKNRKYNKKEWAFQTDKQGVVRKDRSLGDQYSVFQLLKKHVSRYGIGNI
jgi:formate dehydrogenase major subunit